MLEDASVEPIAIVGLACRVPGAGSAGQFWRNLVEGVDALKRSSLADMAALGVPEYDLFDPNYIPAAFVLDDVENFDAALFGMSRRETELRDPQHRLFLELSHTALEDAGYDPARYDGEIGVYGGIGGDEYQWRNIRRNPAVMGAAGSLSILTGCHPDYLPTHVSYNLNLRGPSMTVHTACSTTLVAFHLACEALRNGECDMALTGGASIELPHGWGYSFADGGIMSPDGHTRTFDESSAGTVWSSGGGVVVLKRLSDAIADGDNIRAIVRGSAVTNDGADKVGFSAPGMEGQTTVIAQALGIAEVDPRSVSYVEAHGTATGLGDTIEVAALTSVFSQNTDETGWCGLGSVKTNIGHLGPVAGIAGVIKTTMALENRLIPPSLHFERPNPKLGLDSSPFYVNSTLSKWEAPGGPLRAGVSSFGIGGTNAHAVLEQAPEIARERHATRASQLLQISAHTDTALSALAERLSAHLAANPSLDLADVAYTLRVGRKEHAHRTAVVASTATEAAAALADRKRRVNGNATARPRVAFLLSGQGAQYAGMGAQLYREEPVFQAAIDECVAHLDAVFGRELLGLLTESQPGDEAANARLAQTEMTQPALFVIEYALAQLWKTWGVSPSAMIGHSVGEYVAATLAGVFSVGDALRLVAARGRLMQSMPAGSMLAVRLEESELIKRLPEGLSIATINGPMACVVAGPTPLIDSFAATLDSEGVGSKALRTSHAFHSPMMEPILAEFRDLVAGVQRHAPSAAFLSNVTGTWMTAEDATDPSYWAKHLREAVRFGDCVATLLSDGDWLLVECGPGRQLAGLARMHTPREAIAPLASLPAPGEKKTDLETLYAAAGQLWTAGIALNAKTFGDHGYRVPLVPYPYERKRYWVDPIIPEGMDEPRPEPIGPRSVDQWFTLPVWKQTLAAARVPAAAKYLVFSAGQAGDQLAKELRAAGSQVIEIKPSSGYAEEPGRFHVRPGERADYDSLVSTLAAQEDPPAHVVHAWTLDDDPAAGDPDRAWQAQDNGFFSLLNLVQAVAAAQLTVHIDVLTIGTQDVTGTDATRPEHATVAGIAKVVPLESPTVTVRHIDLGATSDLKAAFGELASETGAVSVALRAGRRWVQDYEQAHVPETEQTGLRHLGVYLITGGLGGLGITLAEDLAEKFAARLVLLARSPLPAREEWNNYVSIHGASDRIGRAITAVRRMEAAGAQVLVLAADVTRVSDLQAVRERTLAEFGRLDGIIHAAGVAGGGMAEVKERAVAETVLAPKVRGTLALQQVFADLPMDFVALFSSVTAVAGGFGQVDYCAANNFLDSFARGAHGFNAQVTSMNWGGWLEVGMAAEVVAPQAFRALQRGDRVAAVEHPVITSRHTGEAGQPGWASGVVAPATHWVLDEHRISGVPVMPGTGQLETVRAAFASVSPGAAGQCVELRDVVFLQPMAVSDGGAAELRVEFSDGTDGLDFQVISVTAGATVTHVRGTVRWTEPAPANTVDIETVRAKCALATYDIDAEGDRSKSGILTFGPRWASLRRIDVGSEEQLAFLEAPAPVLADLDRWVLHPALLDVATAFARGTGEGQYLPMGYGRLLVRGALPARLYSHLRQHPSVNSEIVSADLALYDEAGQELVTISDFMLRRIDGDAMSENMQGVGHTVAAVPEAAASTASGIGRADGAEAFRRALGRDLGRQVVITAQPLHRVLAGVAGLTQETVIDDLAEAGPSGASTSEREGYIAPRTEAEAKLAAVWGAVLGVDAVSAEDDFFELGGNSLIAVQLISQIRKTAGVKLPLRSLFEAPTVAGMARLVEGLKTEEQGPPAITSAIPRLPRPRSTETTVDATRSTI